MRTTLTIYPVRRISVATARRRKTAGARGSFGRMLSKLDAASDRLARSRPRR